MLNIVKLKKNIENPNNQMNPYEQVLGNSRKEKRPCNRKKPPVEPGLGRGGRLPRQVWGSGEGDGTKRHCEENQSLVTND